MNKIKNESNEWNKINHQNTDFYISGLFYNNANQDFRKILEIKKENPTLNKPDLLVIMMNPGCSKPVNGFSKDTYNKFVGTVPDQTQYQIMKIMIGRNKSFARILNLSDLVESKSKEFYSKISEPNYSGNEHSIFSNSRTEDFEAYFINEIDTILAWGVNPKLDGLIGLANNRLGDFNKRKRAYSFPKQSEINKFYHPLTRNPISQEVWRNEIIKKMRSK